MTRDLIALRETIARRESTAEAALQACLDAAGSPACAHAYIRRFDASALAAARAADARVAAGAPLPPLSGLAVSIKDLFDVAGAPTTAGSLVLANADPAADDAPAVARLRAAGAAITGHTNMTEFAFSGVGINPHHGTPANAATKTLDSTPRIPGGSSSGAGVTLAAGAAWAALGSDTGGSIRIPAALHGLVGFKSTARLVPTEGAVPLSTTLDTAGALTRSVRDAVLLHEVLAQRSVPAPVRPLSAMRFAVPTTTVLDGLDADVARAFDAALRQLRNGGAQVVEQPFAAIGEIPSLQARCSFSPAEAWAWHRRLITEHEALYDPRVARRIRLGETMGAADYIELLQARREWIGRMTQALRGVDALLSPTVPMVAPPIAPLLASDDAFFATNALLLRNPSIVNFLDGCALTLPCHPEGSMPVGLMVWRGPMDDDLVLEASLAIEGALAEPR